MPDRLPRIWSHNYNECVFLGSVSNFKCSVLSIIPSTPSRNCILGAIENGFIHSKLIPNSTASLFYSRMIGSSVSTHIQSNRLFVLLSDDWFVCIHSYPIQPLLCSTLGWLVRLYPLIPNPTASLFYSRMIGSSVSTHSQSNRLFVLLSVDWFVCIHSYPIQPLLCSILSDDWFVFTLCHLASRAWLSQSNRPLVFPKTARNCFSSPYIGWL